MDETLGKVSATNGLGRKTFQVCKLGDKTHL